MKKFKLFAVALAVVALASSCGQGNKKVEKAENEGLEIIEVTIDTLLVNAAAFEDQTVQFTAKVDHTCKHSGKKLSVFGNIEGKTLKVLATETSPVFSPELSGKTVNVIGVVRKVIEEHSDSCEHDHDHDHSHDHDHDHEGHHHYSYHVDCIDFSEVE